MKRKGIAFALWASCMGLVVAGPSGTPEVARGKHALMETDEGSATYMLQLLWKPSSTSASLEQNLFWFKEVPPGEYQTMVRPDGTIRRHRLSTQARYGDGFDGSTATLIGIKSISLSNVCIELKWTWTGRKGETATNEIDEVFCVPFANVETQTKSKIFVRSRWWTLAQPGFAGDVGPAARRP